MSGAAAGAANGCVEGEPCCRETMLRAEFQRARALTMKTGEEFLTALERHPPDLADLAQRADAAALAAGQLAGFARLLARCS